jgi:hypothetical protein
MGKSSGGGIVTSQGIYERGRPMGPPLRGLNIVSVVTNRRNSAHSRGYEEGDLYAE